MKPRERVQRAIARCVPADLSDFKQTVADDITKALLAMPIADRVWLAEQLLLEPPVDEVKNALPLVLYFKDPIDREAMVDAVAAAYPGMGDHAIPDQED